MMARTAARSALRRRATSRRRSPRIQRKVRMTTAPEPVGSTPITWGAAVDGLRLGLSVKGVVVGMHLQNVGDAPLDVLSYVQAHERHFDWYSLVLTDSGGDSRTLAL